MTSEITSKEWEVGVYIQGLLQRNTQLRLQDVFYGDQNRIGKTPCAAVDIGPQINTYAGAPFRLQHEMTIFLMLYLAKIKSGQLTKLEADKFSTEVVDVLHSDKRMGGLVISGFVTRIEPGFATRSGELMQAVRLTWSGTSKTNI